MGFEYLDAKAADKVDLLLGVNAAAMQAGASFINSILFLVNEQKYFASTDGSYIDQDVHRIWAPMQVTAVDQKTGKFRIRAGLSAPRGMGFEYLDGNKADKVELPGGAIVYGNSYDMSARTCSRGSRASCARRGRRRATWPRCATGCAGAPDRARDSRWCSRRRRVH